MHFCRHFDNFWANILLPIGKIVDDFLPPFEWLLDDFFVFNAENFFVRSTRRYYNSMPFLTEGGGGFFLNTPCSCQKQFKDFLKINIEN
jgi:hypothetical protein